MSRLGELKGTNLLADIGNGTMNILYVTNKKAQESRCWTEKFGVNQCMITAKNFLAPDTGLPPYLVFPRFLLDMELNETTKLLYMILLDRARLSLRNEGWTDASGHVFLYFTIEAMAKVLHKSQMTIKTSLAALENKGLILRKRQGAGHPNRIYVKFPEDAFRETDRILSLRQTENCPVIRKR